MAIQQASEATGRREYGTGFPVRCTETEKQTIFEMAQRANRSASRFVVELAVAAGAQDSRPGRSPEELVALEGLTVQLRRLASNLQELASRERGLSDDDSEAPAAAEIDDALLEVRGMIDNLHARLA